MMITLIIYLSIIGYIFFKAFYTSIKPFNSSKNKKIEIFQDSISFNAIPFYFNQGKINLFAFFINFLFLSFISLLFLPDLISNHMAFCQDSDSSIDSDHGKSITHYYRENDIYEINKTRKEEIAREERLFMPSYEYGSRRYYPDNYEGIYKKTIEEAYRISDKKFPYIHILNSFSYIENENSIDINNYLKVFQGFSKDLEILMEKQNNLIQKITPIDKHSFKISKISYMFNEISKRSLDILVLISYAYDNIMDSFYNDKNIKYDNNSDSDSSNDNSTFYKPSIYYLNESENSNGYKLFNKILDKKTNGNIEINNNIKSFFGNYKEVNDLNFRITKIFNSLEIISKISKENSNNLHELIARPRTLKDLNLKINSDNILIIQDIHSIMSEENQIEIKNFEKLYHYYKNFDSDDNSETFFNDLCKINWNKIENIHCNIRDFYKSKIFIKNPYQIENTGFILKNINQHYDESSEENYNYFSEDDYSDGGRSSFDSIEKNNMGWDNYNL